MKTPSKLVIAALATHAAVAFAQPGLTEPAPTPGDGELNPPSFVEPTPAATPTVAARHQTNKNATTERWGGGVRLTGLSGIGALPGVNYGGELAGLVRHDELFAELALGRWKPKKTYVLAETPEHVELGLDVWTLRGGWASMTSPLRGWALVEVGEMANARAMPGVVTRMMTGDTPMDRRWKAVGAGFGVAWPMSNNARLVGMIEIAVPVSRQNVALETGAYQPDPLAARSSAGLEIGWR